MSTSAVVRVPPRVGAFFDMDKTLIAENYGERTINISPDSIYTGALGAALFARQERRRAA